MLENSNAFQETKNNSSDKGGRAAPRGYQWGVHLLEHAFASASGLIQLYSEVVMAGSCEDPTAVFLQVTQLFGQYVSLMLQTYASNPNLNWKEKDCAIYLVVALTVRQKTAAQGATATNQLVNIGDFFTTQIEPELKKTDGSPVLRADALKFVTTFRSQVSSLAGSQMAVSNPY
jgi:hypothetical protein